MGRGWPIIAFMRDFDDSTLWDVSEFERVRRESGGSGFVGLGRQTVLPTTLLADLRRIGSDSRSADALEVVAACMRHRESALLCLQHESLVWPVTVFPMQGLYHSPRDMAQATPAGWAGLKLLGTEPPGVRAPGHWMHERVAHADHYRPLAPLLWRLALHGPRSALLAEIAGPAAYRFVASRLEDVPRPTGAIGSAMDRMRHESVSLRQIATWPGMSTERASRLLNALYLASALIVSRATPAAHEETGRTGWFGLGQRKP
jgi:hypothetical protein